MDFRIEPVQIFSTQNVQNIPVVNEAVQEEQKSQTLIKYHLPQLVITKSEYKTLMKNRPLIKYRPLKNSFTKKGDKILLAEALGIEEKDVDKTIDHIILNLIETGPEKLPINTLPGDTVLNEKNINVVEPYIYRHGTKEQVIKWLKYELSDVKTVLQKLYKTLDNNSGGLYDYFSRPCHLLDNHSMKKIDIIISSSLNKAQKAGYISKSQNFEACEWAMKQIYSIQNNNVIQKAVTFIYRNS